MYRFVDLTTAYWADSDDLDPSAAPMCGIIDTVTDRFLQCDGSHVLSDLEEVRDAGGDRAVGLVPEGFFERRFPAAWTAPGVSYGLVQFWFEAEGELVVGRLQAGTAERLTAVWAGVRVPVKDPATSFAERVYLHKDAYKAGVSVPISVVVDAARAAGREVSL